MCKQTMDVLYQKLIVCNVLQCRTAESRRSVFALRLFGSVLKKAGAEKRHTEEVPRRNAASPEWETDIHHHQTEEMTQTDKTEIRKECNKCLYFWESSLRC